MSRFNRDFRGRIANRVCRHFDKYCEFVNPVPFDALTDVYRPAFNKKEWKALEVMLDSKLGRKCLSRSDSFELMTDTLKGRGEWERDHITFGFPDGKRRPDVKVEFAQLHVDVQDNIRVWVDKALKLKKLRKKLYKRVDDLFDWEWDDYAGYNNQTGGRRGGPTPGVGCNTPGQLMRIWPELMAFLPVEHRDVARGANVKSRMPLRISGWGTVDQFLSLEPKEDQDPKELAFERRVFDALTHILVQMSLMIEVRHVEGYPSIHLAR